MAAYTTNQLARIIWESFGSMPQLTGAITVSGDKVTNSALTGDARKSAIAWLDTAIAIVRAESGGDPNAKNSGSNARGLWQIMTSVHQDKIAFAVKAISTETGKQVDIFNPYVNTMVASDVYAGAGKKWTPWEAYNTGAYKRFLGEGEKALKHIESSNFQQGEYKALRAEQELGVATAEMIGNVLPTGQLANLANSSLVQSVLRFTKDAGMTIGVFLLGVIMLILGIWFILSQSQAGKQVGKVAKMTPVGKVLS